MMSNFHFLVKSLRHPVQRSTVMEFKYPDQVNTCILFSGTFVYQQGNLRNTGYVTKDVIGVSFKVIDVIISCLGDGDTMNDL